MIQDNLSVFQMKNLHTVDSQKSNTWFLELFDGLSKFFGPLIITHYILLKTLVNLNLDISNIPVEWTKCQGLWMISSLYLKLLSQRFEHNSKVWMFRRFIWFIVNKIKPSSARQTFSREGLCMLNENWQISF